MSSIPGIGDVDDDESVPPPILSHGKRALSVDASHDGGGRSKRLRNAEELDDEDRELYGDEEADSGRALVAGMTLVTEKLPSNESDFLRYLLSDHSRTDSERQRIQRLFAVLEQLRQIDTTNVFQVTFITCLSLETEKRIKSITESDYRTFYPFLKMRRDNMMELSCFRITSMREDVRLTQGQLVSVRVMPIDQTVRPVTTLAYVSEAGRRLPDRTCRLEAGLLKRVPRAESAVTLVYEILLTLPLTENLFNHSKYHVSVAPVCRISDLLVQARAVYDVAANPLFRYLQTKDFALAPTGILISSDSKTFSQPQLEAIQRAYDLVTQPVPSHGNPCKSVFIDGQPGDVCSTVTEVIRQLLTSETTKSHQYIVTSSESGLLRLHQEVKRLLPDLKAKHIFFAGHDSEKISSYASSYIRGEIDTLSKSLPVEVDINKKMHDTEKKSHLELCLSFLNQSNSSAMDWLDFHADIHTTVDHYKHEALHYLLRSARLMFGTLKEFSQSPDLHQHLQSPKVYPSPEPVHPDSPRHAPISVCMIADADSLTDPELMSFAKEFSICRFILSSCWLSGRHPASLPVSVQNGLSDRLRKVSSVSSPPLVVEV